MPKSGNIKWTPKQKKIAALLNQGIGVTEIVEKGHSRSVVQRVKRALENQPPPANKPDPSPSVKTPPPKVSTPPKSTPDPIYQTKYRIDTSELANLGAIQGIPQDWRLTQHGFFLLLDTYDLTKEEIGYEGTMGEFLTDMCRLYRALMQYNPEREVGPPLPEIQMTKEEPNGGTGEPTNEGASSHGEDGGDYSEEAVGEEQRAIA